MISELNRLFAHLTWADLRVLEYLRRLEGAEAGELRLFSHVLGSERLWLARLRGGDTSALEGWPGFSLTECASVLEENTRGYASFLESLDEERLEHPVEYQTTDGTDYRTRVGDILLHVTLHASHHRGQIARLARDAGREPVNVDYITFAREGFG